LSAGGALAMALLWTVSAVPFLRFGYGSDVDAWTVSSAARRIWSTGVYSRSRSFGFPLYELTVTPLIALGGWIASNLLSLAAGLVLFGALVRLGRRGWLAHPWLAIATLMFLPIIFKNATSTMDYVPALALLAWAYVAWLEHRPWLCAVLVGVACGFRPTSGLFIVAPAIATFVESRRLRVPVTMCLAAAMVGVAAFWPSLRLGAFPMVRPVSVWEGIKTTLEVFGIAQTPLLAALAFHAGWRARRAAGPRAIDVFHLTNIAVFGLAYAVHAGGSEYLLPAVFSVVLFVDRHASTRAAAAFFVVAMSYHVVAVDVQGSRGGLRPIRPVITPGLTVQDVQDRRFKLWFRDAMAAWPGTQPTVILERFVHPVIADPAWSYDERLNLFRHASSQMAIAQISLDPDEIQGWRNAGFRVVVWREREWMYARPPADRARPLIEFVDDLGDVLGVPRRGSPLD